MNTGNHIKLISHRGNINGCNPKLENTPDYIKDAIHLGYDVEIDIWYSNNTLWLGHDNPEYQIDLHFLLENANKSLEAGCNLVLYCSGNINDNFKLIKSLPYIDQFTSKKTSEFFNFLR